MFVQGTKSIASKGKQSGRFTNDKHLNENFAEFEDVSQEEAAAESSWDVKEENIGKHDEDDDLVKSLTGFDSAQEKLVREVQKLKDVGKDDSNLSEPESTLASGEANMNVEDLLKKTIEAEVEYVAIRTTTESLTAGMLNETKRQKNIGIASNENSKLETREDIKKLQNRVCKFTSCVVIQLILLLVTLYLQFSSPNMEVVPT